MKGQTLKKIMREVSTEAEVGQDTNIDRLFGCAYWSVVKVTRDEMKALLHHLCINGDLSTDVDAFNHLYSNRAKYVLI